MKRPSDAQNGDLVSLIPSFERSLRARSPRTIRSYVESARLLAAFLAERGMPTVAADVRREHVEALIEDQLERWAAGTAASRFRYIQQFFRWLEEEGEIPISPMAA
ncbi:MAG: site-specific integrase [Acidimicrobiales bacterium]